MWGQCNPLHSLLICEGSAVGMLGWRSQRASCSRPGSGRLYFTPSPCKNVSTATGSRAGVFEPCRQRQLPAVILLLEHVSAAWLSSTTQLPYCRPLGAPSTPTVVQQHCKARRLEASLQRQHHWSKQQAALGMCGSCCCPSGFQLSARQPSCCCACMLDPLQSRIPLPHECLCSDHSSPGDGVSSKDTHLLLQNMAEHMLQQLLAAKSNINLRWRSQQCNLTRACLGVVPGAGEDVDLDWHPPLAVALQLADLTAQNLQALADVEAMQVQHDGACAQQPQHASAVHQRSTPPQQKSCWRTGLPSVQQAEAIDRCGVLTAWPVPWCTMSMKVPTGKQQDSAAAS